MSKPILKGINLRTRSLAEGIVVELMVNSVALAFAISNDSSLENQLLNLKGAVNRLVESHLVGLRGNKTGETHG